MHKIYELSINVSYAECESLYIRGSNTIIVTTTSGLRVQLPTSNLRPFVEPHGIRGRFELVTSEDNKIIRLRKIL